MIISPKLNVYYGPNTFSSEAVILCEIDIDLNTIAKSQSTIDFLIRLSDDWFGYNPEACFSEGAEKFANFLVQFAHAALTCRSGGLSARGHRLIGPNKFALWIGFYDPRLAASALSIAISSCEALTAGTLDRAALRDRLEGLWRATSASHPDFNTNVLIDAAKAMGLPVLPAWNVAHHWQFGWGSKSVATFWGASNRDGVVSNHIMADKRYSKTMIEYLGFPVPAGASVSREEDIPKALEQIGFPCVVKPSDQGQGRGVSAGLVNIDQVRTAFRMSRQFSNQPIIIEQYVAGSDHRLMMVDGKMIGAFRRDPPTVTGDGRRTVAQLVEELNRNRVPPETYSHDKLFAVALDEALVEHLGRQGLSLDTILSSGMRVGLKSVGNVATGGTSTDVTRDVHPEVRMAAEMIAKSLDVRLAGFDFITTDISRSWRDGHGAFIELNLTPGLDAVTMAGWSPVSIGKIALGSFPGRIPIGCVIVQDDDVARMERAYGEAYHDDGFGWASHLNARVGSLQLKVTAREPWAAIKALLGNRTVDRALIIVATGHLVRYGFPIDRVSQVWNCDPDLAEDWQSVLQSVSSNRVETCELSRMLVAAPKPIAIDY